MKAPAPEPKYDFVQMSHVDMNGIPDLTSTVDVKILPGNATAETITDLFFALSNLQVGMGGHGLHFNYEPKQ